MGRGQWLWWNDQVKDSGRRSCGSKCGPAVRDDEREEYSGVKKGKARGEEREIERRAIQRQVKKGKGGVHTSSLRDGTAPGRGIYLRNCPCQMGSER